MSKAKPESVIVLMPPISTTREMFPALMKFMHEQGLEQTKFTRRTLTAKQVQDIFGESHPELIDGDYMIIVFDGHGASDKVSGLSEQFERMIFCSANNQMAEKQLATFFK